MKIRLDKSRKVNRIKSVKPSSTTSHERIAKWSIIKQEDHGSQKQLPALSPRQYTSAGMGLMAADKAKLKTGAIPHMFSIAVAYIKNEKISSCDKFYFMMWNAAFTFTVAIAMTIGGSICLCSYWEYKSRLEHPEQFVPGPEVVTAISDEAAKGLMDVLMAALKVSTGSTERKRILERIDSFRTKHATVK